MFPNVYISAFIRAFTCRDQIYVCVHLCIHLSRMICASISARGKQRIIDEDASSAMQCNDVAHATQYRLHVNRRIIEAVAPLLYTLQGNSKLCMWHISKWALLSLNCLYGDCDEVSFCHKQCTVGNDISRTSIPE